MNCARAHGKTKIYSFLIEFLPSNIKGNCYHKLVILENIFISWNDVVLFVVVVVIVV